MRVVQLDMIDAGSSTRNLSVQLSVVETSLRTQTALEIAQGASAAIISTHFHVLRILAVATNRGWYLFCLEFRLCGWYLRAATNQRKNVHTTLRWQTII